MINMDMPDQFTCAKTGKTCLWEKCSDCLPLCPKRIVYHVGMPEEGIGALQGLVIVRAEYHSYSL